MSHSKVSFKAHYQPPLPTPTFSHAKIKWSNFPLVVLFSGSVEPIKLNQEHSLSLQSLLKRKITAHTLDKYHFRLCQCSFQVFYVVSIFFGVR